MTQKRLLSDAGVKKTEKMEDLELTVMRTKNSEKTVFHVWLEEKNQS